MYLTSKVYTEDEIEDQEFNHEYYSSDTMMILYCIYNNYYNVFIRHLIVDQILLKYICRLGRSKMLEYLFERFDLTKYKHKMFHWICEGIQRERTWKIPGSMAVEYKERWMKYVKQSTHVEWTCRDSYNSLYLLYKHFNIKDILHKGGQSYTYFPVMITMSDDPEFKQDLYIYCTESARNGVPIEWTHDYNNPDVIFKPTYRKLEGRQQFVQ